MVKKGDEYLVFPVEEKEMKKQRYPSDSTDRADDDIEVKFRTRSSGRSVVAQRTNENVTTGPQKRWVKSTLFDSDDINFSKWYVSRGGQD